MPKAIYISGVGSHLPGKVLTNHDIAETVDTSNEWIIERTGIEFRHIASEMETTSYMGFMAAKAALADANLTPADVDMIILATMAPDMICPSTACVVQKLLGCRSIPALDVGAACSGFMYILELARSCLLSNKNYKNILIIGSEKLSAMVNWEDRSTCVLFGDGAGAAVVSKGDYEGIIDVFIGADGSGSHLLTIPAGGSAKPASGTTVMGKDHCIKMDGREVFRNAIKYMGESMDIILKRNNLTANDMDCVIPHQANMRIINMVAERANIGRDKLFCNLNRRANTSAASIPIALDEAIKIGKIKTGDMVLLVAFGAGMTWGASIIKWK
ncbi:MAG: ketoacyl-ACP synthase III [Puniceicoccales bacterium]|jgi:3-oxoacyl-[acyl-carrier-protein] synthase-3|nr:ketoacyl-ACP synthase III [Puniceicoccales bacterium]